MACSLPYAAPEILAAVARGARSIQASASADVWALGVVALELLAGRRAFAGTASREAIVAQVTGDTPLPWEPPSATAPELLRRLRVLKRSVLACLARDPAARPTAEAVLDAWHSIFDSTTTAMPASGALQL